MFVSIILLHVFSFCVEYFYQTICYPITWYGFFTSLVTSPSMFCNVCRHISYETNKLVAYQYYLFFMYCWYFMFKNKNIFCKFIKQS